MVYEELKLKFINETFIPRGAYKIRRSESFPFDKPEAKPKSKQDQIDQKMQ